MAKATRLHGAPRTSSVDPIIRALENHQRLDRVSFDLVRTGAPERDVERAGDAAERAAWRMARTRPTTSAGAAAVLAYITTEPVTGLFELGECDWHETAFRTVVAALAEIHRRGCPPDRSEMRPRRSTGGLFYLTCAFESSSLWILAQSTG